MHSWDRSKVSWIETQRLSSNLRSKTIIFTQIWFGSWGRDWIRSFTKTIEYEAQFFGLKPCSFCWFQHSLFGLEQWISEKGPLSPPFCPTFFHTQLWEEKTLVNKDDEPSSLQVALLQRIPQYLLKFLWRYKLCNSIWCLLLLLSWNPPGKSYFLILSLHIDHIWILDQSSFQIFHINSLER